MTIIASSFPLAESAVSHGRKSSAGLSLPFFRLQRLQFSNGSTQSALLQYLIREV